MIKWEVVLCAPEKSEHRPILIHACHPPLLNVKMTNN